MKKRYILGIGNIWFLTPDQKGYKGVGLLTKQNGNLKSLKYVGKIGDWIKGKLIFEVEAKKK